MTVYVVFHGNTPQKTFTNGEDAQAYKFRKPKAQRDQYTIRRFKEIQ